MARYWVPRRGLVSSTRAPRRSPTGVRCSEHHSKNRSRAIAPHWGQVASSVWAIPPKAAPDQPHMLHHTPAWLWRRVAVAHGGLSPDHQIAGAAKPSRWANGRSARFQGSGTPLRSDDFNTAHRVAPVASGRFVSPLKQLVRSFYRRTAVGQLADPQTRRDI